MPFTVAFEARWRRRRAASCATLMLSATLMALGFAFSDEPERKHGPYCMVYPSGLFLNMSNLVLALLIIALVTLMRRIADQFFIKRELKLTLLASVCSYLLSTSIRRVLGREEQGDFPVLESVGAVLHLGVFFPLVITVPLLASYSPAAALTADPSRPVSTFHGMLQDAHARNFFRRFLVESFCPENLIFWETLQEYRLCAAKLIRANSAKRAVLKLLPRALRIYTTFIARGASIEVNLPHSTTADLHDFFSNERARRRELPCERAAAALSPRAPDRAPLTRPRAPAAAQQLASLYERAEREVLALMSSDPFRRFSNSALFAEMLADHQRRVIERQAFQQSQVV
jgi:hypothetical protein